MSIFAPVQWLADRLTYNIFLFKPQSVLAGAVNFFIFDTLKIFILLAVIIFAVSIIRSYLPPEKIRAILSHRNKYTGNVAASLLGIVTPFCSCSAVPLFLGFVQAGVPLGATFSFLVSSPMINEVAVVLLLGLFGWKVALIYITSGLAIAIISGIIIGRLKVENLVEPFVYKNLANGNVELPQMTARERVVYAKTYTADILKKVWPYILVGIALGAWIHGYVPVDFLVKYAGSSKWYGVPLAVLIGVPLYSNAAGVIPLVSALTEKGVSMGTTLAFMMSITALSLPEFMILKKVMKTKLVLIFAGIVAVGITLTGYMFNFILK
ncbi:MAG: permease [Candidatus Doudnabacteria bacterium]|nr:permease [Candidatus Doudnabacteria bacterium]